MPDGVLLDTNVVSEMIRTEPNPTVMSFLMEQNEWWLPAIVLHELVFGIEILQPGRRREQLDRAVSDTVARYRDRIVPLGHREAASAALLRGRARREGRALTLADALIAGTAAACDLTIATRNVRDFEYLGLRVVNPWSGR